MNPWKICKWLQKLQLLLGVEHQPVGALWTLTFSLCHWWKSHNCDNLFKLVLCTISISNYIKKYSQETLTPSGWTHLGAKTRVPPPTLCETWSVRMFSGNSRGDMNTYWKLPNNLVNGVWPPVFWLSPESTKSGGLGWHCYLLHSVVLHLWSSIL